MIKIRRITEAGDQLVTCTLEELTPALLFPPYYPLITILPSGRTVLTVEEVLEEARKTGELEIFQIAPMIGG